MRILYVENHAIFADQNYQWNNAPSDYVWQRATGTTPPTGPLASVATRPYDQTVWGGGNLSIGRHLQQRHVADFIHISRLSRDRLS